MTTAVSFCSASRWRSTRACMGAQRGGDDTRCDIAAAAGGGADRRRDRRAGPPTCPGRRRLCRRPIGLILGAARSHLAAGRERAGGPGGRERQQCCQHAQSPRAHGLWTCVALQSKLGAPDGRGRPQSRPTGLHPPGQQACVMDVVAASPSPVRPLPAPPRGLTTAACAPAPGMVGPAPCAQVPLPQTHCLSHDRRSR